MANYPEQNDPHRHQQEHERRKGDHAADQRQVHAPVRRQHERPAEEPPILIGSLKPLIPAAVRAATDVNTVSVYHPGESSSSPTRPSTVPPYAGGAAGSDMYQVPFDGGPGSGPAATAVPRNNVVNGHDQISPASNVNMRSTTTDNPASPSTVTDPRRSDSNAHLGASPEITPASNVDAPSTTTSGTTRTDSHLDFRLVEDARPNFNTPRAYCCLYCCGKFFCKIWLCCCNCLCYSWIRPDYVYSYSTRQSYFERNVEGFCRDCCRCFYVQEGSATWKWIQNIQKMISCCSCSIRRDRRPKRAVNVRKRTTEQGPGILSRSDTMTGRMEFQIPDSTDPAMDTGPMSPVVPNIDKPLARARNIREEIAGDHPLALGSRRTASWSRYSPRPVIRETSTSVTAQVQKSEEKGKGKATDIDFRADDTMKAMEVRLLRLHRSSSWPRH